MTATGLRPSGRWGDEPRLRAVVWRYLRTGVRSTQEALQFLSRRGVSSQRAAGLVDTYRAQGLLDDRVAARLWADHWARQGYAASAIRLKLLDKGFDEQLAHNTITRLIGDADDEERARRFVASSLRRPGLSLPAPRHAARQAGRLARLLASRGFDSELIERVLRTSRDLAASDSHAER